MAKIRYPPLKRTETDLEYDGILRESEIVRIADTGKFKVGDGVHKFSELPYSCTIPDTIILYKEKL